MASGWLTRDPIGYAGGINLYAFCGNNPVNRIDPWGFCGDGDGYWHQVGQVFMGYGDAVNPLNWYNGLVGLYGVATNKGLGAAGGALLGGVEHMVTGLGSGDPREFGQTLGGDLLVAGTAAAGGLGGAGEAAEAAEAGDAVGTAFVPQAGDTVYRVFGGDSGALGGSWTPVNPGTVDNFANAAGLPPGNTGEFVTQGNLINTLGVEARPALPIGENAGGLPEYTIPYPEWQVGNQWTTPR